MKFFYEVSCQGRDKILTFGADVCADPDNFRVENPDRTCMQSGQFWWGVGDIRHGVLGRKFNFNPDSKPVARRVK